jgi:hypothetical protein
MRLPKIESYTNDSKIEVKRIENIPPTSRNVVITSDKDKVKLIKSIERDVRSSLENKDYTGYLREYIDMTQCSFFQGVVKNGKSKVSIEIHHEPFTLFDISQIVLEKWIREGNPIRPLKIAKEVMKLHYQNKVGLIPLSTTVHQLVHSGKLFIPLQNVRGNFIQFIEEYDEYISDDLKEMLQIKLKMSKEIEKQDMSIIETKYTYLEVDGFILPETLDEIVTK